MRLFRNLVVIVTVLAAFALWSKPKEPKKPELQVVAVHGVRTTEDIIEMDGQVQNCGERTLFDLVLGFEMIAPEGGIVSTQRGALDDTELKPGEETDFHFRMRDPARAVSYHVIAKDKRYELVVANAGPHYLE